MVAHRLTAIRHLGSAALTPHLSEAVRRLCADAYGADMSPYLTDIGPGDHLLGLLGDELVSHLMWVTRSLQPGTGPPLRTAYVELVATAPAMLRRGFATALLERFPSLVTDYQLAALSPATDGLYARRGWQYWRGPLSARRNGQAFPTPDERVMILPLPKTPALDVDLPLSVEWRPGEVW